MSDTPRTDAEAFFQHDSKYRVCDADFARTLERELNAANQIIRQQQLLDEENFRLQDRTKRMEETLMEAWVIIANVSDGDWTRQKPYWQEAVVQWRDNQFRPSMKELSELKAKEAKP